MKRLSLLFLLLLAYSSNSPAHAAVILGGSATIQFDGTQLFSTTGLTPVWAYDASNGAKTATQAQILLPFGGGGAAVSPASSYSFNHEIIVGSVSNPSGRGRQATNADIDPNSPLASWSGLEQIGLDGITAFSVFPAGGLVTGDFSLLYSTSLNRLSLFNNFQIPVEAFRVNNPTFTTTANGFTVSGDLLTGTFFPLNGIAADQDLGFFTLNAVTAVPEPSSFAILGLGGFALGLYRRRKQSASLDSVEPR